MDEMFGTSGAAYFRAWESQYKLLTGDVRSGAADANADPYRNLKKRVQDQAIQFEKKRRKLWKRVGISALIFAFFALMGNESGEFVFYAMGSIPMVWTIWRNKVHNGELDAAIKFDEQYFDGEVFSRIRNGRLL